jgi:hypothetical protein
MNKYALGFRVKSGFATAVLVSGTSESIEVIDCRTVELSDPEIPDTKQPYHVLEDRPSPTAEKEVEQLVKRVFKVGKDSVTKLIRDYHKADHKIDKACLVVGSVTDPDTILNSHIRAHALEGKLFRDALEEALKSNGISTRTVVEKNCYSGAADILNRSESQLKRAVTELKNSKTPRWRSDEKAACLAAWLAITK